MPNFWHKIPCGEWIGREKGGESFKFQGFQVSEGFKFQGFQVLELNVKVKVKVVKVKVKVNV